MKKLIKKSAWLLAFSVATLQTQATDLCVAENGTGGCYATITDALNAAVNGDRILVNPKSGNAAYVEDLSITKSIQILSNVEATQFTFQGNITIVPANGRSLTIVGMSNLMGNVTTTANCPAGARCTVKLMNCNFSNGSVKFDYDNFDVTVVSSVFLDGSIAIRYGKVIGNDITTQNNSQLVNSYYCSIGVGTDATPTFDTIQIVGNKVLNNFSYGSWQYGTTSIYWGSSSQFFYVSNNYITKTASPGYYEEPIYTSNSRNSLSGRNSIINNTLNFVGKTIYYGIGIYNNQGYIDIYNNLILAQGASAGIAAAAQCGVSYNFMNSPLTITGVVNDGTNNLSSNTTLNASGKPNTGSDAINGGDPDKGYYDINLTVNDAGAYGGSFTLDNFFPVSGAARVYMITAPRKVTVGSTINVMADGFDR